MKALRGTMIVWSMKTNHMNSNYQIKHYSDVIDSTLTKMFFNSQWTQHEYDTLTQCANMKTASKELCELKKKAQELLDYESRFDFRHCQNVTSNPDTKQHK